MLKQIELIKQVRLLCQTDDNVVSAMMYGSFAKGKGDKYSDIEFLIYFTEASIKTLDQAAWLNQIAPVLLTYKNEFGITEVIFDGLIRGEFHFETEKHIREVCSWRSTDWFPSVESTLITDKTGELTTCLQSLISEAPSDEFKKQSQDIVNCYIGWLIFGSNVLMRGELARAHNLLWWIQWKLLDMIRLIEDKFENWCTPSRELEKDISRKFYSEYCLCTSDICKSNLESAYFHSWCFGKKLMEVLNARYKISLPEELLKQLDRHFTYFKIGT